VARSDLEQEVWKVAGELPGLASRRSVMCRSKRIRFSLYLEVKQSSVGSGQIVRLAVLRIDGHCTAHLAQSVINHGGRHVHLGTFTDEHEAAIAFDKWVGAHSQRRAGRSCFYLLPSRSVVLPSGPFLVKPGKATHGVHTAYTYTTHSYTPARTTREAHRENVT
jgi:hypothetical protein